MSELIPVTFEKIVQSKAYTVMILSSPTKKFAIYAESQVGKAIQNNLNKTAHPRPLTYDLIHNLLTGFGIKILQVVITDVEDAIYFARLFLEQELNGQKQIVEIDARPSDCIILALAGKVPFFCRADVLEKAIDSNT